MPIINAVNTFGKVSFILYLAAGLCHPCNAQNCDRFTVAPDTIAEITKVLDLCEPVSNITTLPSTLGLLSVQQRTGLTYSLLQAQARVTNLSLQLTSAESHLDLAIATNDKHINKNQQLLQVATAIIGMVGGGVGGGLHLVNNPQVGHAATLVGISAGVVGGGIGLTNAIINPPLKPSSIQLRSLLLDYNAAVTKFPIAQLGSDPIMLAEFLGKVSDSVQRLQETISIKTDALRTPILAPAP
jgi:hypothetical protein